MYSPPESFVASTAYRERFSWARILVTVIVIVGLVGGAWFGYDLVSDALDDGDTTEQVVPPR